MTEPMLSELDIQEIESPFRDDGELTNEARTMDENTYFEKFVSPAIKNLADIIIGKNMTMLVAIDLPDTINVSLRAGIMDAPFLACAGLLAGEPDDFEERDIEAVMKLAYHGLKTQGFLK